jgi:microcystin degradation protein MlrC
VAVTDPAFLRRLGIEPLERKIVVLKIGYLFAPFQAIAPRSILMLSPGCTNCDLTKLAYERVKRPMYPLDPDASW